MKQKLERMLPDRGFWRKHGRKSFGKILANVSITI